MRKGSLAAFVFLAAGLAAHADTVVFKDGSVLNGKVSYPNENAVALVLGGARAVFPKSDVVRVEENDLVDNPGMAHTNPFAAQHEKALLEKTGLTAEQRREVRELMKPLESPDPRERAAARKRLVAKAGEIDIWSFLASSVPDLGMKYVPEVLQVLCELDRDKARTLLIETTEHTCPVHRGSAVALLGLVGSKEDTPLMARGLVDPDPVVQVSAARGLAALGDRRATPALLAGFDARDPRVPKICMTALSHLWSTEENVVSFETPEEWQEFWEGQAGTVSDAVAVASLKALAEPPPEGVDPTYGY